jgi:hypothetical protein
MDRCLKLKEICQCALDDGFSEKGQMITEGREMYPPASRCGNHFLNEAAWRWQAVDMLKYSILVLPLPASRQ